MLGNPPYLISCSAQWYRRQQRVLLASQRARWEHEQATLAQFTVSESFTLGWLNVLLRHLWPTVIEKEVAEVAAANIRVRPSPQRDLYDRVLRLSMMVLGGSGLLETSSVKLRCAP